MTVDVARLERGGEAVAALVEEEEWVVADGLEGAAGLSELSISRVTREALDQRALRPRRSSNSRGSRSPASEDTVAPRNSTRS